LLKLAKKFSSFTQKGFSQNFLMDYLTMNIYGGAVIDLIKSQKEIDVKSIETYEYIIRNTISDLKSKNINSITVKIPARLSLLIHPFIQNQFYFHHTKNDEIVLCKWLNEKTGNRISEYCHHSVGIGSFIFNKNLEIVLVKEKFNPELWKFVTGNVDFEETTRSATLREVKEETGLTGIEFLGTYFLREVYPLEEVSDICFFNLCFDINETSQLRIDHTELFTGEYKSFKECLELAASNKTTIITKFILQKFRRDFNEFQSLPFTDNIYDTNKIEHFIEFLIERKILKNFPFEDNKFKFFEHYSV
jgi:8-oxo-dGTP pyrophosphatase MutT (NUDIX family)